MDHQDQNQACEDALQKIGWGRYHERMFWIWGLGWVVDVGWIYLCTVLILGVMDSWDLGETAAGAVGTWFMSGQLFGSFAGGYIADKQGRIYTIRRAIIIGIIAGILVGFSVNLAMICIFCFVAGFGIGWDLPAIGSIFIEFCPPDKRWRMTLLNCADSIGGVTVALYAFIYASVDLDEQWRWVTLTVTAVAIISSITRIGLIETPKFYISIHQYEKASQVLKKVAEINASVHSETSFLQSREMSMMNSSQDDELTADVQKEAGFSEKLRKLFLSRLWRLTVPLSILWFFVGIALSGFTLFLPQFMKRSGFSEASSKTAIYSAMMIQQGSGIISQILAAWLIETKLGRKWTLVLGLFVSAIFMILFGYATDYIFLIIASVIFYFFLYIVLGVAYTITPESIPTDVRNFGFGVCQSFYMLAMLIAPLISGALIENEGLDTGGLIAIFIFSLSLILAGVSGLFLKETKDVSIEEY